MTKTFLPEWHPQWGVLLAWPHPASDWADNLEAAEICYTQIVSAISQQEVVLLLCHDDDHQLHIINLLEKTDCKLANLYLRQLAYDDTWARDFGPISILDQQRIVLLDFIFNAWGGKFDASRDNAVNQHLVKQPPLNHCHLKSINLVLEGGSLETDGQGTLLTTETCLLNPNRNPHLSKTQIEQRLTESLGLERILWLKNGHLEGDDTDAHIDTLARFADPQTIVYLTCDDANDSHFVALSAMEQEIKALRQVNGKPYKLFAIPLPHAIYAEDGRRLPASYVNFLIVNGRVLLPIYADERTDTIAIEQIGKAFPQHQIIPIDCRALIQQSGSLHCATMQLPQEIAR
ncbi:agmatine deiminase family protein [Thiolinea disciformis]|uniref:agmatine deiminase family protein n=1 Tax=Thiolinea disciformis TaxID=125614 RepID=UPI00036A44F8|nr:agmatine deiminase family protein [Thiolinea disciformis]